MNWDNIHLDHIKPVSKFNLEDETELLDCCHYTNFQPLLIKDNLNKSNKWSETDELFWNANIEGKSIYIIPVNGCVCVCVCTGYILYLVRVQI
jgi:hypothetical protein